MQIARGSLQLGQDATSDQENRDTVSRAYAIASRTKGSIRSPLAIVPS